MAKEVAQVVNRCNDAKSNGFLDLSHCELKQLPYAIFVLMKNTMVTQCDISHNHFSHLPETLVNEFPNLKSLKAHHNNLKTLPEGLHKLKQMETLDISYNQLDGLPPWTYSMDGLCVLIASNNSISEIDVEALAKMKNLDEVVVCDNDLTEKTKHDVMGISHLKDIVKL